MSKLCTLIVVFALVFASFTAFLPNAKAQPTYQYYFSGPYYYDGSTPSNSNLVIAFLYVNGAITRETLSSTGTTPGTLTVTSNQQLYQMIWSTGAPLNYTLVYDFLPSDIGQTINVYVPSPDSPTIQYQFSVSDFAGMINPYIQDAISINGNSWNTVERDWLNASSTVDFTMAQFGSYLITIGCQQGIYSFTYLAGTTTTYNIPVLAGMFPPSNVTQPTFDSERDSTTIAVSYVDPSQTTLWLQFTISHMDGDNSVTDYTYDEPGNTQTFVWNNADPMTDYTILATADINGVLYYWNQQAAYSGNTNPWTGVFDFLGQYTPTIPNVITGWPTASGGQMTSQEISELIGAALIILFLCVGSFRSSGACCILACCVAGLLLYLGWWYISIPQFALTIFLSILIYIDEEKSQSPSDKSTPTL